MKLRAQKPVFLRSQSTFLVDQKTKMSTKFFKIVGKKQKKTCFSWVILFFWLTRKLKWAPISLKSRKKYRKNRFFVTHFTFLVDQKTKMRTKFFKILEKNQKKPVFCDSFYFSGQPEKSPWKFSSKVNDRYAGPLRALHAQRAHFKRSARILVRVSLRSTSCKVKERALQRKKCRN